MVGFTLSKFHIDPATMRLTVCKMGGEGGSGGFGRIKRVVRRPMWILKKITHR